MNPGEHANPDRVPALADRIGSVTRMQWALLLAPFYLNDLANIWLRDPVWWLPSVSPSRQILWTVAALAGGLVLIPGPGSSLLTLLPETRLGSIPEIPSNWLQLFDLTVGLALVAITEEVVFRGVLQTRLASFLRSQSSGVMVASVLFSLAHWSNGVGSVMLTCIVGLGFGLCVSGSRSLVPTIIAHYVADLLVFI